MQLVQLDFTFWLLHALKVYKNSLQQYKTVASCIFHQVLVFNQVCSCLSFERKCLILKLMSIFAVNKAVVRKC